VNQQHVTDPPGTPCKRCGLVYSIKTCYTACLDEGQTWDDWFANLNEAQQKLVEWRPAKPLSTNQ